MPIKKGTQSIGALYKGTQKISKVYKGTQLAYQDLPSNVMKVDYVKNFPFASPSPAYTLPRNANAKSTTIEITFRYNSSDNFNLFYCLFQIAGGSQDVHIIKEQSNDISYLHIYWGSSYARVNIGQSLLLKKTTLRIEGATGKIFIDNRFKSTFTTYNEDVGQSVCIFASTNVDNVSIVDFFSIKIWQEEQLTFNLIPIFEKISGAYGFYNSADKTIWYDYERLIGFKKYNLPEGITQLEYIRPTTNNRTQLYFDNDYKPTIYAHFLVDSGFTNSKSMIGSWDNNWQVGVYASNSALAISMGGGTSYKYVQNGYTWFRHSEYAFNGTIFETRLTAQVFNPTYNGNIETLYVFNSDLALRWYELRVYDADNTPTQIIRYLYDYQPKAHFIPVRFNTGKYGLFDIMNQISYPNIYIEEYGNEVIK